MSRTYKDKPYSLGGSRHKWYIADNHNIHGKLPFICLSQRTILVTES